MRLGVVIITVGNSMPQSVEPMEHRLRKISSDSAPRVLRSKSSNCFQRASGGGAESERRFLLPSIDRTGSMSAQRRPATSGDVRLNNERHANVSDDVHRPPRASAVTVWNSLTSLSPISKTSSANQTLHPVTRGAFVPSPPSRKNSNCSN